MEIRLDNSQNPSKISNGKGNSHLNSSLKVPDIRKQDFNARFRTLHGFIDSVKELKP